MQCIQIKDANRMVVMQKNAQAWESRMVLHSIYKLIKGSTIIFLALGLATSYQAKKDHYILYCIASLSLSLSN